jgi:hypothetical protein
VIVKEDKGLRKGLSLRKNRAFQTAFSRKFYCYLGPYLFNSVNKNIDIDLTLYVFITAKESVTLWLKTIDLVLIDPQSVGKRTHDLMDTVNAKKRWKTICWRVNKYLKYCHFLTRFGKEQASF